ncbi:facilitated trehalose transporter Tret1-like [Hyposmocoma kahamanoa]|uniref:facilitated trehalose transporter Tret1-like n=1 Tax=Hyposmocoma kahamanoa TaxID=1477025 RepID=UPI000E6D6EA3|nr:facilitated trehalose transporter Tret1-like [Hyposmocoma kahamanoa]
MGILNVWPSYTTHNYYINPNTTVLSAPMTVSEVSSVGSFPSLGAMVGTAVAGALINKIGRQKGGVVLCLPAILSWMVIGQTSASKVILAARFIMGITGGAFLVYGPMFISEIAEDSIRGCLASGPVTFYCLGSLCSFLFGWFLSYNVIIWTNVFICVLGAMLCFLVTESPLYLLRQGREEDALKALAKYRGGSTESKMVLEEISRLKQTLNPAVEMISITDTTEEKPEEAEKLNPDNEKMNTEVTKVEVLQKQSSIKLLFKSYTNRKAFQVVATAITLQVFMGMVPVMVNAGSIFKEAAPTIASDACSVLLALVLVVSCAVTAIISDLAGRRFLIISSSLMVAVCMISLGVLTQIKTGPSWLSALLILFYCFSFNFGAGTVPYVLLAEVFVPEVQAMASMILVEWAWFLNYAILELFVVARNLIGLHGAYYIFGAVSIGNAIISYFGVPETKGLSNQQIQEAFRRR